MATPISAGDGDPSRAVSAGRGRPSGPDPSAAPRLHYVDWLRVFAIAGVFLFHTLRPFDTDDWHVKNPETSEALGALMGLFWSFGLAVLFLLSGAGARFALRRRSSRTFLRERTARLLVPFAAGTLLLSPVQGFIEATHKGAYGGSFIEYVEPWSLSVVDRLAGIDSPTIFGIGYHLWFLGFLFAMSVVALPLLRWLMGRHGGALVDAIARSVGWPGATLGFAVPIAALMTVGVFLGTNEHDWFEFAWYLGYFLIGFLFVSDDRFLVAVRRDVLPAVVVAMFSTVLLVATPVGGLLATIDDGLDVPHVLVGGLFALEGWAWTIVILNVGLRTAALQRPVNARLSSAVLPIYVVHQPVILAVSILVVPWPLGILPKWIVVFGASLAITVALVELGLRSRLTRILLGVRTPPRVQVNPPIDGVPVEEPSGARTPVGAHLAPRR